MKTPNTLHHSFFGAKGQIYSLNSQYLHELLTTGDERFVELFYINPKPLAYQCVDGKFKGKTIIHVLVQEDCQKLFGIMMLIKRLFSENIRKQLKFMTPKDDCWKSPEEYISDHRCGNNLCLIKAYTEELQNIKSLTDNQLCYKSNFSSQFTEIYNLITKHHQVIDEEYLENNRSIFLEFRSSNYYYRFDLGMVAKPDETILHITARLVHYKQVSDKFFYLLYNWAHKNAVFDLEKYNCIIAKNVCNETSIDILQDFPLSLPPKDFISFLNEHLKKQNKLPQKIFEWRSYENWHTEQNILITKGDTVLMVMIKLKWRNEIFRVLEELRAQSTLLDIHVLLNARNACKATFADYLLSYNLCADDPLVLKTEQLLKGTDHIAQHTISNFPAFDRNVASQPLTIKRGFPPLPYKNLATLQTGITRSSFSEYQQPLSQIIQPMPSTHPELPTLRKGWSFPFPPIEPSSQNRFSERAFEQLPGPTYRTPDSPSIPQISRAGTSDLSSPNKHSSLPHIKPISQGREEALPGVLNSSSYQKLVSLQANMSQQSSTIPSKPLRKKRALPSQQKELSEKSPSQIETRLFEEPSLQGFSSIEPEKTIENEILSINSKMHFIEQRIDQLRSECPKRPRNSKGVFVKGTWNSFLKELKKHIKKFVSPLTHYIYLQSKLNSLIRRNSELLPMGSKIDKYQVQGLIKDALIRYYFEAYEANKNKNLKKTVSDTSGRSNKTDRKELNHKIEKWCEKANVELKIPENERLANSNYISTAHLGNDAIRTKAKRLGTGRGLYGNRSLHDPYQLLAYKESQQREDYNNERVQDFLNSLVYRENQYSKNCFNFNDDRDHGYWLKTKMAKFETEVEQMTPKENKALQAHLESVQQTPAVKWMREILEEHLSQTQKHLEALEKMPLTEKIKAYFERCERYPSEEWLIDITERFSSKSKKRRHGVD